MKTEMKTLGLVVIISLGLLVTILLLIPMQATVQVNTYPESKMTIMGKARVGEVQVTNNAFFGQQVALPELTACVGDVEVPLDMWVVNGQSVTPGIGQPASIYVPAQKAGILYLVASDNAFDETMKIYTRTKHFSCLTPGVAR
jgi:hypothetical protein